jgi:hypothetical protein
MFMNLLGRKYVVVESQKQIASQRNSVNESLGAIFNLMVTFSNDGSLRQESASRNTIVAMEAQVE